MKKVSSQVDFVALEHEMLELWKKEDTFNELRKKNSDESKRWSFLDGPITANNPMGVHHAWGRTLKDLFQRYKAMQGFHQRYQNGFDCQGLWVEVEVEKELGFKSKTDIDEYGIEKFVEKCKSRVHKYSAIQTEQSKRLGYWMDWDNSYFTMSDENNYTIWQFLKKCNDRGLIYKGYDVLPWCTRCGAALSEHEIATEGYKELTHTSVYLRFPLKEQKNTSLLVWTTTPWTLTANTAAAVNPELDYVKIKEGDEYLILVENLLSILKSDYEIVEKFKGTELEGLTYTAPFADFPAQQDVQHRVVFWDEVSDSDGTGIVHIAPGCGQEDFQLGKEENLSVVAPIDQFGNYLEGFDWLTGKDVMDVGDEILEDLSRRGIRYKKAKITHRYPTCWRHGSELVFRLVNEWYISMDGLREEIAEITKQINWIPKYGMARELDWLKNMSDWMISKKRYWGLALPIFECECGHFEVIGSKEELKERTIEGWEQFEGHSPHRPVVDNIKIECEKCGKKVNRVEDVGNPWLDAGIVPYSTMHYMTDREYWEKWFPAEFITECFPGQFRNWFYALLAMSTMMENKPPFKTLLGHALVKDQNGDDMHKSAGNAIWFEDAAEEFGVDVMRWMYTENNPTANLLFGEKHANDVRRGLLTLWNTYSFFVTYAELDKFDPNKNTVPVEKRALLDRWILSRMQIFIQDAEVGYESFDPPKITRAADHFIRDLSNWYVRRSRRRFWKSENDGDKFAAFSTLYEVLVSTIQVLAPVIPFMTESMYQNLVRSFDDSKKSIHLTDFPKVDESQIDRKIVEEIERVIHIVELGRAARNAVNIKIRQPLQTLDVVFSDSFESVRLDSYLPQILEELNIKSVNFLEEADDVIQYAVKLNFQTAGKKFGKLTPKIKEKLDTEDGSDFAAKFKKDGVLTFEIEGETIELTAEELEIVKNMPEGLSAAEDHNIIVILHTELTDELLEEGAIRELIRHIQNMRKDAGFEVQDKIIVSFEAEEFLSGAIEKWNEYLRQEVLAESVSDKSIENEMEKEFSIDGNAVKIGISRI